ncbi:Cys-Gly metallodipeptidase dug1 [Smittium culicis]|uniref:Cys-Gly metallodipeptidase dug1 n=1 Tax=Smittium culicis TaxID=133412 RepID=A0A1R1XTY7_9FUNG|nr:Cys-Gly metallodipeptidase dug1 [Smittium culicis]OMJ18086.1 Cys-Gly metallodipeptidase dug1 [Smittium culicis]
MDAKLEKYFKYVDENTKYFIDQLREVVAIPSVSADHTKRHHVVEMGKWLEKRLLDLGCQVKMIDIGMQTLQGVEVPLPPVVLASYGDDKDKKTITIYGHYDVQPALLSDGWNTEPFTLVEEEDGRLVGRGATDDKGPVLGWLLCLEAHQKLDIEIPVNLKFCFEGMEESGSIGLDDVIIDQADKWFKGTDYTCISDNYWLGTTKPALTYGLRGNNYFHLEVSGPQADLHSGVFGGVVQEPMTILTSLLNNLVDINGKITIPHMYDQVAELTEEEDKTYSSLSFQNSDLINDLKADIVIHSENADSLKSRWRYPSLSIHGIEGAFYDPGSKTVIPSKVTGKFSIRSVPFMDPATITKLVIDHVNSEFAKLDSKCKMRVWEESAGRWWYSSPNHPNFVAGSRAIKRVFNVEPEMTREGGSIPVTLTFEEALKTNVLLLPMGAANDGAHSTNEKVDKYNYINGIKLYGAYWAEIAALAK